MGFKAPVLYYSVRVPRKNILPEGQPYLYRQRDIYIFRASLMAQWQRISLPMQETWVQSLGRDDPLEKEMTTHSSIFALEIPWTEEPGGHSPQWSQKSQT